MKAIIKVGYRCNQHCRFCHRLAQRNFEASGESVHSHIVRAKQLGHTMVVLSGGEPTIRPELRAWASHVAALDMDLGLITNAQMLAYPEVVAGLVERRLSYVHMSLHGGVAALHDEIVGGAGFGHARAAIDNLVGRGIELVINTVVTRANLEHLRGLVDLCKDYPDVLLKFSMVEPRGGGREHFAALTPRVAEVGAAVVDAIAHGEGSGSRARFAHDGIPLCLLPGCESLASDLVSASFATMVEADEADFVAVDDRARIKPHECQECSLRGGCPGLYRGYHDRRGAAELAPRRGGARSNSFNYVLHSAWPQRLGASCPLLDDGVTPWARGRDLFVVEGQRMARYHTSSRDFDDGEILAAKELGQIYRDVSNRAALSDFAKELEKLERSDWCRGCREYQRCTGTFAAASADVFTRDDSHVVDLLSGMRGRILDVGCGDGRYSALLAPRAGRGEIDYIGIDPDGAQIAAHQQRWPQAQLSVVAAEDFVVESRCFDHLLLLRSWNHLADPERVISCLLDALRLGGVVTIVDNVGFGLARSRAQSERAERSTAALEHYRNDGAEQAWGRLSGLPLEIVDRVDVGPSTSNQWLLRLRHVS